MDWPSPAHTPPYQGAKRGNGPVVFQHLVLLIGRCLLEAWPTPLPCADDANKGYPLPTISCQVLLTKTSPKGFQVESLERRKCFCLPDAVSRGPMTPRLLQRARPMRLESALETRQMPWRLIEAKPSCPQRPTEKVQTTNWHHGLATLGQFHLKKVVPTASVCWRQQALALVHVVVERIERVQYPCGSRCAQTGLPPHQPRSLQSTILVQHGLDSMAWWGPSMLGKHPHLV